MILACQLFVLGTLVRMEAHPIMVAFQGFFAGGAFGSLLLGYGLRSGRFVRRKAQEP